MSSSTKKTEVRTFRVRLYCECGGEMTPTGTVYPMYPPLYQHRCEKCGKLENVHGTTYPETIYEEVT